LAIRVFRVPLESLPERYTVQWNQWFPSEFERLGFEYYEIPGASITKDVVETGKVLDASGTMYFKFSQMQRIAELFKKGQFKNGDVFFIDDIQFPGAWAIKYMAELYKIKVYLFGYLHASSYTKEDFAEPMSPFLKSVERSWIFLYDKIFVGTNYHKNAFCNRRFPGSYRNLAKRKIHVSGAPWNTWSIQNMTYKSKNHVEGKAVNRVIFPNRFDIEKRPNVFLKLADYVANIARRKDIHFVITTSRKKLTSDPKLNDMLETAKTVIPELTIREALTKEEYYCELSHSYLMVSTTIEENFGYCVTEALTLNTPVLVPNNYSHPEILKTCPHKDKFLYDTSWDSYKDDFDIPSLTRNWQDQRIITLGGQIIFLLHSLNLDDELYKCVTRYNQSIENMCEVIKEVVINA